MKICYFGTYDPTYTSNRMILDALRVNGATVYEVNAPITVTRLDKPGQLTWFEMIKRVLRKYRILVETWKHRKEIEDSDAIYVGYPGHFDVLIAFLIAKIFRKKLVFNPLLVFYIGFVYEQGILDKNSILAKILKAGEMLIYRMCDMVFADTPFQKEFFLNDYKVPEEKIRVLPIGAESKYYRYTPITKNKSKQITVVYYGLYSPIHGVEYLIEAANKLRNDKDVKFIFIGQGNKFEENYKKAQDLSLTNIEFIHDVPLSEHPQYMEKADVFLGFLAKHPTVDRVIPNKVYQGLALGKVVLTADAPVIRSVFKHKENVYLCEPANSESVYKAINYLKVHPSERINIAENGYKLFRDKYSPEAVGKQLIGFINEIL